MQDGQEMREWLKEQEHAHNFAKKKAEQREWDLWTAKNQKEEEGEGGSDGGEGKRWASPAEFRQRSEEERGKVLSTILERAQTPNRESNGFAQKLMEAVGIRWRR
ncbi:MAG: hypothetical protein OJJ21_06355 [Ferrovibrio sp.]|uniref:hypothetical protein n=1 Tax=Ferrovibrio sp. TaxID=1917215 RepID=UPI00262C67DA|nr:hypothetical protein [Ferrovibrio sp.]MCW0233204.1 hypothetical protein [Ferrovibrio sp.]